MIVDCGDDCGGRSDKAGKYWDGISMHWHHSCRDLGIETDPGTSTKLREGQHAASPAPVQF